MDWEFGIDMYTLLYLKEISILKIALALWGRWCFHTNYNFFCSNSVKNAIGNLIRIALKL